MAVGGNALKHLWAGKLQEPDAKLSMVSAAASLLESDCVTNSQDVMRMALLLR